MIHFEIDDTTDVKIDVSTNASESSSAPASEEAVPESNEWVDEPQVITSVEEYSLPEPPTQDAEQPEPEIVQPQKPEPVIGYTEAPGQTDPYVMDKQIQSCGDISIHQTGTTFFTDGTTGWTEQCANQMGW